MGTTDAAAARPRRRRLCAAKPSASTVPMTAKSPSALEQPMGSARRSRAISSKPDPEAGNSRFASAWVDSQAIPASRPASRCATELRRTDEGEAGNPRERENAPALGGGEVAAVGAPDRHDEQKRAKRHCQGRAQAQPLGKGGRARGPRRRSRDVHRGGSCSAAGWDVWVRPGTASAARPAGQRLAPASTDSDSRSRASSDGLPFAAAAGAEAGLEP